MNIVIKSKRRGARNFTKKFFFCAAFLASIALGEASHAQNAQKNRQKIFVQEVEVVVDNIQEKRISSQISEMAKNALNGQKALEKCASFFDGKKYAISINLCERSFYKNLDSAKSIYTHYQLFSESGECVLENVFCSEGKSSIVSTLVQQKQIARIARDVKKYFLGEKIAQAEPSDEA